MNFSCPVTVGDFVNLKIEAVRGQIFTRRPATLG